MAHLPVIAARGGSVAVWLRGRGDRAVIHGNGAIGVGLLTYVSLFLQPLLLLLQPGGLVAAQCVVALRLGVVAAVVARPVRQSLRSALLHAALGSCHVLLHGLEGARLIHLGGGVGCVGVGPGWDPRLFKLRRLTFDSVELPLLAHAWHFVGDLCPLDEHLV